MVERDQKGSFIVDDRSVLTTAAARIERLNSAYKRFEAFINKDRPKSNAKEAEDWESRKQGMKKKHAQELKALKAVTLADVKVRGTGRYQGDAELREELQREIEDAYSTRASAEEGSARVFITPIEMEVYDPASVERRKRRELRVRGSIRRRRRVTRRRERGRRGRRRNPSSSSHVCRSKRIEFNGGALNTYETVNVHECSHQSTMNVHECS